jgi:hypothetical protein
LDVETDDNKKQIDIESRWQSLIMGFFVDPLKGISAHFRENSADYSMLMRARLFAS